MKLHIKMLTVLSCLLVYNICFLSQMHAGPQMGPPAEDQSDCIEDNNDSNNNDSSSTNDSSGDSQKSN